MTMREQKGCPGSGKLPGRLLPVLLLALLGTALAQTCPLGGASAIADLAQVVRLLEPALPRSLTTQQVELPTGHPDFAELVYLRERRVIARGAQVDPMSLEVWQAALDHIASWYGLRSQPTGVEDPEDATQRGADLGALLRRVERALRPAALVAYREDDRERIEFLGLVWNWSAYPRLVVRRPGPDPIPEGRWAEAARRLGNCVYDVSNYLAASAPVARDLFLAENRARMYLVGSEPDLPGAWPYEVPQGAEIDVFAFTHPMVAGLDAYSAVFVGDGAPVLTMARHFPSVRSNLSLLGLTRIMQTPPR